MINNTGTIFIHILVMTDEERLIADLGKPKLGEKNTLRIRIRESKEFKVCQFPFPFSTLSI